jgi:hypothetical protein
MSLNNNTTNVTCGTESANTSGAPESRLSFLSTVIILFYLFRVGRAFGTTKMFNYKKREMD